MELTNVYRQKKQSKIIEAAHTILNGNFPSLPSFFLPFNDEEETVFDHSNIENHNDVPLEISDDVSVQNLFQKLYKPQNNISWEKFIRYGDFRFIECKNEKKALQSVLELLKYLPKKFAFDPIKDIQILTPMRKGILGSRNINTLIQSMFNPSTSENFDFVRNSSEKLILNDKVMQIVNNYDKEVFNGEIGIIKEVYPSEKKVVVEYKTFDVVSNELEQQDSKSLKEISKMVSYQNEELHEITTAYSMTVHKSQGCEFPVVIMIIHPIHLMMLEKNLLYTGVTRSKTLTVLIGTSSAVTSAIRKTKSTKRFSFLKEKIASI